MGSVDTMAGNGDSATSIESQSIMDLFSLKGRTIIVTGEWNAAVTGLLAGTTNYGIFELILLANVFDRGRRRTGTEFRECVRSSRSQRCCNGHCFCTIQGISIAREDGRQGQILSVGSNHRVVLEDLLTDRSVDVTDAEMVENATQDVVKDFGNIDGW